MTYYQQQTVNGEAWTRCYRIVIDNPSNSTPSVRFYEERLISVGDTKFTQPVGELAIPVSPEVEIDLIHPDTGELLGSKVSHAQLYVMLHSAYVQSAKQRDDAATAQPGPEPEPEPAPSLDLQPETESENPDGQNLPSA